MTVDDGGFELLYTLDPAVWLAGPDETRPVDVWLPGATAALVSDFGVTDEQGRQYVETVLRRFAIDDSSPLTDRLLRWRHLDDDPFPLFVGVIERADWPAEDLAAFVGFETETVVEPPVVTDLDDVTASVRRGVGYSQGEGSLVCGVRYVVDDGDPDLVTVMMTATSRPGQLIEALTDFDELARSVRVVRAR
ncbi:MAG: hypothetical protein ABWX74_16605 [Aeromicrobium sp.]